MFTKSDKRRKRSHISKLEFKFCFNFRKLITITRLPSFNSRKFLICAFYVSFFVFYLMQLLSNIQAWKTETEVKDRKPCEK